MSASGFSTTNEDVIGRVECPPDCTCRGTRRPDSGFGLVELIVVMALIAILAPAITALMVTTIRTLEANQAAAERLGLAVSSSSIAGRVDVVDECDGAGYEEAIAGRLTLREGWSIEVSPDCSEVPTVLEVAVVDARGRSTELVTVRP